MVERIVERDDGAVRERAGSGGIVIAIALLVAVVIVALYLFNRDRRETATMQAVTTAAGQVGEAAGDAGGGARDVARRD